MKQNEIQVWAQEINCWSNSLVKSTVNSLDAVISAITNGVIVQRKHLFMQA